MSTSATRRNYAAYASAGDHYGERGIHAATLRRMTTRDVAPLREPKRPVSFLTGTQTTGLLPSGTHDRSPSLREPKRPVSFPTGTQTTGLLPYGNPTTGLFPFGDPTTGLVPVETHDRVSFGQAVRATRP